MVKHRGIIISLALVIGTLCGCGSEGSNQALITASDGEFSCAPSEIVELINGMVATDSGGLLSLDDYQESGETIHTSDPLGRLSVSLEESEDGNLTSIRLYWSSASNNKTVITSAGAYCGVLLNNIVPDRADEISDSIGDIMSEGYGEIETACNGVIVSYQSLNGLNWLDIKAE